MAGALGSSALSCGVALLHVFLPSCCAVCGAPRKGVGGGGLCAPCWSALPLLEPSSACTACALPNAAPLCRVCAASPPPVARTVALTPYEGVVRRLVHAFKFRGYDLLAARCGSLMADAGRVQGLGGSLDAVVAVPSTARRNRDRGYDPGALLAREVARRLGAPCRGLLSRIREAPPQSTVPAPERGRNVRGAFAASRRALGLRLLLVDDVLTTGATAFEAARALRLAGAAHVDLLVLARTPEGGPARREPQEDA